MAEECSHRKVYANITLYSYPPQRPWICSKCGSEGTNISDFHEDEMYDKVMKQFKK